MTEDKALGMDADITRRDFINGTAIAVGALAAGTLSGPALAAVAGDPTYPPAKMGMRGAHPGSFEYAHLLRDGQLNVKDVADTSEVYDCVVVGAGMSGLAAAHFFLKGAGPSARVLVLDNHDDFGGHARRNEFTVDGKSVVINAGTHNIESPQQYNRWAQQVLDDIGVDIKRYQAANADNSKLYGKMGLCRGMFFDKQAWKKDHLVVQVKPIFGISRLLGEKLPLSAKALADFNRLLTDTTTDYLSGKSIEEKKLFLATTSFKDYYEKTIGVDPQVMWLFENFGHGYFSVGPDAVPALFGWAMEMPGFAGLGMGVVPEDIFMDLAGGQHGLRGDPSAAHKSVHFPDGNATLARLLVSKLVPNATRGRTQEDMGTAVIDYGALDRPDQSTRIRLSSIVVNVRHDGEPWSAKEAVVTYVNGGKLKSVRGKAVILASWNMMIPYIMPELPQAQKDGLAYGVKTPIVFTNVALRNWRAWEKLKISTIESPGMYYESAALAEPASLGSLLHPQTSAEPIAVRLIKTFTMPGLPRRDQHRAGRQQMLDTSFEEFERQTRSQLARMLAGSGFDPARDIAGITVNRWPHGYAYTYNSLYDPIEWVFSETPKRPCVVGRQPFGLVSIANSDAAASPHTDAAFQEAHRAVQERLERRAYPFTKG